MVPLRWYLFCLMLPWHRLRIVRRMSGQTFKAKCGHCGREYAFNDDIRVVLPWSEVASLYDSWPFPNPKEGEG